MTGALGGAANVKLAEAAAGVKGVQQLGDGLVHLIFGLNAEQYATEMKGAMTV